jgi:dnd system-associated protein 4
MARRVRIPLEHEDFVRSLAGVVADGGGEGVFESMAEVLAFAAYFGFSQGKRVPLNEISRKIDPIRAEYLPSNAIDVLALLQTKGMEVFGEEAEDERFGIFEEYASGGLGLLADILQTKNLSSMRVASILSAIRLGGCSDGTPIAASDCIY